MTDIINKYLAGQLSQRQAVDAIAGVLDTPARAPEVFASRLKQELERRWYGAKMTKFPQQPAHPFCRCTNLPDMTSFEFEKIENL